MHFDNRYINWYTLHIVLFTVVFTGQVCQIGDHTGQLIIPIMLHSIHTSTAACYWNNVTSKECEWCLELEVMWV